MTIVEDVASIACEEQYIINQAIQKCRNFVKTISTSSILSNFISS